MPWLQPDSPKAWPSPPVYPWWVPSPPNGLRWSKREFTVQFYPVFYKLLPFSLCPSQVNYVHRDLAGNPFIISTESSRFCFSHILRCFIVINPTNTRWLGRLSWSRLWWERSVFTRVPPAWNLLPRKFPILLCTKIPWYGQSWSHPLAILWGLSFRFNLCRLTSIKCCFCPSSKQVWPRPFPPSSCSSSNSSQGKALTKSLLYMIL